MRPMMTKPACLKCHGDQGYKAGDVRGGVGVSVAVAPYLALEARSVTIQAASHVAIWLLGLAAILVAANAGHRWMEERLRWEEALERRTADLAARSAELEYSNAELQQFAYVASHDLREPLNVVEGYAKLLDRHYRDRLGAEADEFLGYMIDGVGRMKALIRDILALSRIGSQGEPFAPADLEKVLGEALANLAPRIGELDASISHDLLPTVEVDRRQLARVFQNLLGNAMKYRKRDEPPRIHVGVTEGNGEWTFSVADNGIGIESRHFDKIFLVFQRLHPGSMYEGTGVGLAICKRIVERHGGRIWVESEPDKGSEFFFTLPTEHHHDPS